MEANEMGKSDTDTTDRGVSLSAPSSTGVGPDEKHTGGGLVSGKARKRKVRSLDPRGNTCARGYGGSDQMCNYLGKVGF